MSTTVIGIVGGIGSGKSAVADAFVQRGGFLVQGDQLGHQALKTEPYRSRVVERFGKDILGDDGQIVRRRLGAKVFADANELKALEAIVFPFIEGGIRDSVAQKRPERFIVLDAAILIEAGWSSLCDKIVFVDVPHAVRLQRLKDQRGWSEQEVAARESKQMDLEEKKKRANAVIDNQGTIAKMTSQVEQLLRQWNLASSSA